MFDEVTGVRVPQDEQWSKHRFTTAGDGGSIPPCSTNNNKMKTKELIAKLQEEDPSGQCFICWEGVPISAEISTEGPFAFVDENDRMNFTMNGYRVVIKTKSMSDFITHDLANWYAEQGGVSPKEDRDKLIEQAMTYFDFRASEVRNKLYTQDVVKLVDQWINKQEEKS